MSFLEAKKMVIKEKMTRIDFLKEVFLLFSKGYDTKDKLDAWKRAYEEVLPNVEDWDYRELYKVMLCEYENTIAAPSAAWLYRKHNEIVVRRREQENQGYKAMPVDYKNPYNDQETAQNYINELKDMASPVIREQINKLVDRWAKQGVQLQVAGQKE